MKSVMKFAFVLMFLAGPSLCFAKVIEEPPGLNDQVSGAGVAVTGHDCGACSTWVFGSQTTQVSHAREPFSGRYDGLMPAEGAPAALPATKGAQGTDGVGR